MSSRFERLDGATVFEGPVFAVGEGRFRHEDGEEVTRQWVAHPGSVGIVAHDGEHVWLVRQPREAVGRPTCSSCPRASSTRRGRARSSARGASWPRRSARPPSDWEHLKSYYASVGFTDERVHVFLATGLRDEPGPRDRGRADHDRAAPARRAGRADRRGRGRQDGDRAAAAARPRCAPERARCTGQAAGARRRSHAVHGHRDPAAARTQPFEHLLLDFLAYLEFERGLSRNTLEAYRSDLLQYGEWLRAHRARPARGRPRRAERVRRRDRHGPRRTSRPRRPATIQRKIACLRSFYRHLRRTAVLATDPTAHLRAPEGGAQAAAGAQPRRGRRAAAPAARDRARRAARPRAAGDDVRVRPARVGGDRAGGRRPRPRGRDPARPRQGRQGAPGAGRLGRRHAR